MHCNLRCSNAIGCWWSLEWPVDPRNIFPLFLNIIIWITIHSAVKWYESWMFHESIVKWSESLVFNDSISCLWIVDVASSLVKIVLITWIIDAIDSNDSYETTWIIDAIDLNDLYESTWIIDAIDSNDSYESTWIIDAIDSNDSYESTWIIDAIDSNDPYESTWIIDAIDSNDSYESTWIIDVIDSNDSYESTWIIDAIDSNDLYETTWIIDAILLIRTNPCESSMLLIQMIRMNPRWLPPVASSGFLWSRRPPTGRWRDNVIVQEPDVRPARPSQVLHQKLQNLTSPMFWTRDWIGEDRVGANRFILHRSQQCRWSLFEDDHGGVC